MEIIYYLTILLLVFGVPSIVICMLVGLIKPSGLQKILHLKNVPARKRVVSRGLLSTIGAVLVFGTIIGLTEPESVRQQVAAQRAQELALQKQEEQQKQKKLVDEQARIKREAEPKISTKVESEVIAFKTEKKNTNTLRKGQEKVETEGRDGERTITLEIVTKNGVETSRKKIKAEVTKKPIDKVVLVGTRENVSTPKAAPKAATKKNAPAVKHNSATGITKMSRSGICHDPSSRYYSRTLHYTSYNTLAACLGAGGRLPKQ